MLSPQLISFRQKSLRQALQISGLSLFSFVLLMAANAFLISKNNWLCLLFILPLHWFHSRLFVIMHDCGHHSFTNHKALNNLLGHICGFFFFTPFFLWRQLHNRHHRNQGQLEQRGRSLDIWVMTKDEYLNSSPFVKLFYRAYRHPFILFGLAPFILFLILFRIPFENFSLKTKINILVLNLIYFSLFYFLRNHLILIAKTVLPFLTLSFILAAWLFYIQHHFEDTLWLDSKDFTNELISLSGSSFYKLPAFLNWTTASIGFHHIHHLDTMIPLYQLQPAHTKLSEDFDFKEIGLLKSFQAIHFKLWDTDLKKMISLNQH